MILHNVSVTMGEANVLGDVSCSFPAQGVTGLVGQNGSGKSTLLRVLARQQKITTGRVDYEGAALDALPDLQFARRVAYLPQHTPAASGLTVRELVALGRYPWHGALGPFSADDAAHVERALALMNLKDLAERFVESLSGGERQRSWLAMLIAQNARLLLLDEPISALDVAHQIHVLRLIQRIARQQDIGVIVVIHDLNLAARYCDTIIALKRGRLIASGSAADIMTPAALGEIYDVTMNVVETPETGGPIAFVREAPAEGIKHV
jgi:iron complex transport system ATP-binding protein